MSNKLSKSKMKRFDDRRDRFKKLFRISYWILCSVGFLYQTSQLFSVFFGGKTISDNRIERLRFSELPAITLCMPWFMSIEKFGKKFPHYNSTNRFWELLKNATAINEKDVDHTPFEFVYREIHYNFTNEQVQFANVFEDLSIDDLNIILMEIFVINEQGKAVTIPPTKWFRSIRFEGYHRICFTQLSLLDESFVKNKTQIIEISIKFIHKNEWYYHSFYGISQISFSLHSANIYPNFNDANFQPINNGYLSLVQYREIHNRLLPPPYETQCKEYDIERNGQNMRSDCITECMTDHVMNNCSLNCINDQDNVLLYREGIEKYKNYPICNSHQDKSFDESKKECLILSQAKAELICEPKCPKNCREIHYEFDVSLKQQFSTTEETGVRIIHSINPDQIIEHRPLMTSMHVLSNFGSLMGMWLGLSIFYVLNHLIKLL